MRSSRRPALVTTLVVGVLILTAVHWTRLFLALSLPNLPLSVPVWYLALAGAVWGTIGLFSTVGLVTGRTWAPKLTSWGGTAYVLWFWVDRVMLARSDYAVRTRPFELGMSVVLLACVWWVLRRTASRTYFQERSS